MTTFTRLRRRRDEGGAAAVEFALVLIPLLWIVFGLIQYGWYFYAMQTGTSAVSDAVRRVTVGDCQSDSDLRAFIHSRLGSATTDDAAGLTITRTYTTADGGSDSAPGTVGGQVTIEVQFDTLNMHFPFIPVPDGGAVDRQVSGRIEDTVPSGSPCT
jgi:Flp pilus assembly protein TadG